MARSLLWFLGLLLLYEAHASASPQIQDIEERLQEVESANIVAIPSEDQSTKTTKAIDKISEESIVENEQEKRKDDKAIDKISEESIVEDEQVKRNDDKAIDNLSEESILQDKQVKRNDDKAIDNLSEESIVQDKQVKRNDDKAIDNLSEESIVSLDSTDKLSVQSEKTKSVKRRVGNSISEKHRCSLPLGMEDGRIPDNALTASSYANVKGSRASRSRLNTVSVGAAGYGSWIAARNDGKQWLQIDLGDLAEVTRIATQGRQDANHWTTRYFLSYSVDNVHWVEYKTNSHTRIFSGNTDRNTIVSHNLAPTIKTRFIKFHVKAAQGLPALRVELFGCRRVHSCSLPVGIEDGRIPDSAMTASSIASASTKAYRGRLNLKSAGWISKANNANQYLRIDLSKDTSVTKVATQGRFDHNHWITSYYLRSSLDGTHWVTYKQNSVNKIFSGNADRNTVVSHVLNPRIEARFIEFKPRSWQGRIVMRVEVYGCNSIASCRLPLGLEDGRIPNAAMSASTIHNGNWKAERGRLNGASAWITKTSNPNEYIQVDFVRVVKVTSVATQGRSKANQYVKSYWISHSIDGSHWTYVRVNSNIKVFSGNNDDYSIIRNQFFPPLYSRFVRLHPKSWHGFISMRMELYGCSGEGSCFAPLGIEDGRIPDQFFSASTIANSQYKAAYSRLNNVAAGSRRGSWTAGANNAHQWLQVDLGRPTTVTKIATQGRQEATQYVQSYKVSYSLDGSHWSNYRLPDGDIEIFGANADRNTLQFNHFSPAINAKFIRVHPLTWTSHVSMRFELYGCYMANNCLMPLGAEDGRIQDAAFSASSINSALYAAHFARLNIVKTRKNFGGWCPKSSKPNQWIQIEFNEPTVITKIATQGRQDVAHWIKSFRLEYSYNARHWAVYKHNSLPVVFAGNFDQHTIRQHHIFPAIYARFLRLTPLTWQGFICMRLEVYGCSVNGMGEMTVTSF